MLSVSWSPPSPCRPAGLTYHGAASFDVLAERYRRCDVFVAPSTGQESFGIVLLEAMSAARPIICSDIVGYRLTVAPASLSWWCETTRKRSPTQSSSFPVDLMLATMGAVNQASGGGSSLGGVAQGMRSV